jgi:hypothetical protein
MTPSTGAGGHDDQQGGPRALQGRRAAVDPARVLGDQEPEQDQLHHREQPPSGHPPRCGMPTYRTVAASTAVASATAARRQHWTVLADPCRQHRSWRCSCRRPRRQPRIETPTGRSRPMKAVSDDHQPYVVCVCRPPPTRPRLAGQPAATPATTAPPGYFLAAAVDASSGAPGGAPRDPAGSDHLCSLPVVVMVAVIAWFRRRPSPWHAGPWPPRPPSARSRPDPAG